MRNKLLLGAACLSLFSLSVYAQNNDVARQVLETNEKIALLSAQLKQLELESNIAAKQREIMEIGIEAVTSYQSMGGQSAPMPQTEEMPMPPSIVSIEGIDGKLSATLIFGDRSVQIAKQGEVIKDGWNVAQITPTGVTLSRKGERVKLGFGATAGAAFSGTSQGAFTGF